VALNFEEDYPVFCVRIPFQFLLSVPRWLENPMSLYKRGVLRMVIILEGIWRAF